VKLPKKAQVIYCNQCDTDLYRVVRDIELGEPFKAAQFEAIGNQRPPLSGARIICDTCFSDVDYRNIR
jgi:hypothetical protein